MTQLAEKLHPWVASGRPAGGPRWLQDLRERGATFSSLGFPTVRDEEWRFTNVAPITGGDFQLAGASTGLSWRAPTSCRMRAARRIVSSW